MAIETNEQDRYNEIVSSQNKSRACISHTLNIAGSEIAVIYVADDIDTINMFLEKYFITPELAFDEKNGKIIFKNK